MPLRRPQKVELVQNLTEKVKRSQSIVLSDFKGMTVAQMSDLRTRLRDQAVEMHVIKNRLVRRAIADAHYDAVDEMLTGNTAVAFGISDAVAPAKVLVQFAKENDKLRLKGGLLEGRRLDAAGIENLSKMPGRTELLTIMARDLKAPATKMATVFNAGLLKMAYAMQALGRARAESDGPSQDAAV